MGYFIDSLFRKGMNAAGMAATGKHFLGYALAEAYVQTFDGKGIKAKTEQMIDEIKGTFNADLTQLAKAPPEGWMDAGTAAKAAEKVGTITQKVGGPEKWGRQTRLSKGHDW